MTKRSVKNYYLNRRLSSDKVLFLVIIILRLRGIIFLIRFMTEHLVNKNMPRTQEQNEEIKQKTRKQILDAALVVFAHKGFHGSSMSDIAKKAGISKGLAYNYFSGKKDLAESVLKSFEEPFKEMTVIFDTYDDPYKIIELLIKGTINQIKQNEEYWRLYLSFLTQIEMAEMAKTVTHDIVVLVISKMEKLFRKIGLPNPKAEAYILGAILDGIPLDYLMDKENYPINSVEKRLLQNYSKEILSQRAKN